MPGSLKIQYNRNRYYDYYTGRWLTQDPAGYIDGMNLYEYVQSNPVVNNDPIGLSLKSEAINKLKKFGDEHAGYDYYTRLTGLQSLIADKLIPALEWLDENDYRVGGPKYDPDWHDMYLPRDASGEEVFHEAIHAYNDKRTLWGIDPSSRVDEGMAYTAQYMTRPLIHFRLIEDGLKKDVLSIGVLEMRWKYAWRNINRIRGKPGDAQIKYAWADLIWRWTHVTDKDVKTVAKLLGFKLSCEQIAKHYNEILKTHPNWKKARCPRFICTTIPFVNVKSFHLTEEVKSVFK